MSHVNIKSISGFCRVYSVHSLSTRVRREPHAYHKKIHYGYVSAEHVIVYPVALRDASGNTFALDSGRLA